MDNTKFTKGRWEIIKDYDDAYSQQVFNISNEVDECMATIWTGEDEIKEIEEQTKANALLISKAPEMIEMLSNLYNDLKQGAMPTHEEINSIKHLIKEATEIN